MGCSAGPSASGEARRGAMPAVRPPHGAPEASGNGADAGAAQPVGGLEALVVGKGLGGTSGAGGSDGCGGTRRRRAREARTHARPLEEVRSAPNVGAPGKGHASKGHASTADGRRTQPLAAPDLWVENSLPVMGVHPSKGRRRVQSAQPTTRAQRAYAAHIDRRTAAAYSLYTSSRSGHMLTEAQVERMLPPRPAWEGDESEGGAAAAGGSTAPSASFASVGGHEWAKPGSVAGARPDLAMLAHGHGLVDSTQGAACHAAVVDLQGLGGGNSTKSAHFAGFSGGFHREESERFEKGVSCEVSGAVAGADGSAAAARASVAIAGARAASAAGQVTKGSPMQSQARARVAAAAAKATADAHAHAFQDVTAAATVARLEARCASLRLALDEQTAAYEARLAQAEGLLAAAESREALGEERERECEEFVRQADERARQANERALEAEGREAISAGKVETLREELAQATNDVSLLHEDVDHLTQILVAVQRGLVKPEELQLGEELDPRAGIPTPPPLQLTERSREAAALAAEEVNWGDVELTQVLSARLRQPVKNSAVPSLEIAKVRRRRSIDSASAANEGSAHDRSNGTAAGGKRGESRTATRTPRLSPQLSPRESGREGAFGEPFHQAPERGPSGSGGNAASGLGGLEGLASEVFAPEPGAPGDDAHDESDDEYGDGDFSGGTRYPLPPDDGIEEHGDVYAADDVLRASTMMDAEGDSPREESSAAEVARMLEELAAAAPLHAARESALHVHVPTHPAGIAHSSGGGDTDDGTGEAEPRAATGSGALDPSFTAPELDYEAPDDDPTRKEDMAREAAIAALPAALARAASALLARRYAEMDDGEGETGVAGGAGEKDPRSGDSAGAEQECPVVSATAHAVAVADELIEEACADAAHPSERSPGSQTVRAVAAAEELLDEACAAAALPSDR